MQFQNIAKIHNAVPGRSGPLLTLGHRLHCLKVIKSINQPMTRVSNIIDLQLFTIHAVTLQHFPKAHWDVPMSWQVTLLQQFLLHSLDGERPQSHCSPASTRPSPHTGVGSNTLIGILYKHIWFDFCRLVVRFRIEHADQYVVACLSNYSNIHCFTT